MVSCCAKILTFLLIIFFLVKAATDILLEFFFWSRVRVIICIQTFGSCVSPAWIEKLLESEVLFSNNSCLLSHFLNKVGSSPNSQTISGSHFKSPLIFKKKKKTKPKTDDWQIGCAYLPFLKLTLASFRMAEKDSAFAPPPKPCLKELRHDILCHAMLFSQGVWAASRCKNTRYSTTGITRLAPSHQRNA